METNSSSKTYSAPDPVSTRSTVLVEFDEQTEKLSVWVDESKKVGEYVSVNYGQGNALIQTQNIKEIIQGVLHKLRVQGVDVVYNVNPDMSDEFRPNPSDPISDEYGLDK